MEQYHGTTIVSVRRGDEVVIGGDGQVSLGNTIMKGNACKVRRLYNDQVITGFAGGTADAFTLFERFEANGNQLSAGYAKAKWMVLRSAFDIAIKTEGSKINKK